MLHERFGILAISVMTGAVLLTACKGQNDSGAALDGPAQASNSADSSAGSPRSGAAVAGIGAYAKDAAGAVFLASVLTGSNEVPVEGKPAVGDKDGSAVALMRIQGHAVSFAFTWTGTGTPNMAHLHEGEQGSNGDVKIPFFMKTLKDGSRYVYGTVNVADSGLLKDIAVHPERFYFNLHTAEFPGGAVRGQALTLPSGIDLPNTIRNSSVSGVVKGAQVYACTKQADGSYAFTQDNVDATLQGDIQHSFAKAGPAGPPQWIAKDGSSVTGSVVNKFDNGEGNVPQLILKANQTGKDEGLLARTNVVLRLNTHGGVAPAGTCDPAEKPEARVAYTADYLFLAAR
ncbi:CHRD domain-containing protein [Streptomyces prunicolor]|uniref:CHRD domain-containing protein n=1 Tax=Streptomyces prunicolor TaxID=67348 RepID=UPI00341FEF4A